METKEKEKTKNWFTSLFTDKDWDFDLAKVVGFIVVCFDGVLGADGATDNLRTVLSAVLAADSQERYLRDVGYYTEDHEAAEDHGHYGAADFRHGDLGRADPGSQCGR